MGEDVRYRLDSPQIIGRRFDLYKQLGFGTLRTEVAWRRLEAREGDWSPPPYLDSYLSQAVNSGFRLKLTIETLGGPPGWFLKEHPDALIRNADGEFSNNDLSLWYPGLHALLAQKADQLFDYLAQRNLFGAIDWIFVDLGPASEPIYPAAWTMGKTSCQGSTQWFYDSQAESQFATAMRAKYQSLAQTNRAWGTSFGDWTEVMLPRPGQKFSGLWNDALIWYRDSKRDFIRWQTANYQRALSSHVAAASAPNLIVMVPGRHISPQEWEQSVESATPDCRLATMTDTEFLLDFAKEAGCALQYTADENGDEVQYLRQYMRSHGNTQRLWGENVGVEGVARDPGHLADVVLANGLYGMDYIRSSRIFGPDHVTPNETFPALATACQRLLAAW